MKKLFNQKIKIYKNLNKNMNLHNKKKMNLIKILKIYNNKLSYFRKLNKIVKILNFKFKWKK